MSGKELNQPQLTALQIQRQARSRTILKAMMDAEIAILKAEYPVKPDEVSKH
jgi:hypothetical protein